MKKYAIFLVLFLSQIILVAQSQNYSRVKVYLNDKTIGQLAALGLDAEHGDLQRNEYFTSDFSENEIQQIKDAGFEYDILIADVKAHYVAQNQRTDDLAVERTVGNCTGVGFYNYDIPENFALGSMGGFLTYQEMLENLDAMYAQYPNLITQRTPIGDILTHEGRPIYWLRISDNPQTDELNEPEVFYNALHHAREPNSLSQLIYYMWYLLERYDSDPEIQYLLNNTELYFVPMINPDGYIYNQTTDPNGGGLWRKNKRDNNGDGTFAESVDGVDLNRNYDFEWGFDDNGSSSDPGSAVYRGPSAFSEPELQNVRDFCNAHNFEIALNYHTFGNLLIYPWGYADELADPIFVIITEAMKRENNYFAGTAGETVGYQVNGVSDDWMYGEISSKALIYSISPEVGYRTSSHGFWPPSSEIIRFCQSTVLQNLTSAHLVLNYGLATDLNGSILEDIDGSFEFEIKRYGLKDGDLTVSLLSASDNVIAIGNPQTFTLDQGQSVFSAIDYTLDANITPGESVHFVLAVDNGLFTQYDTIVKSYSLPDVAIEDNLNTDNNWTNIGATSNWGLRSSAFHSAPTSMADSPNGTYQINTENVVQLSNTVSLLNAETATLRFWAKWQIEKYYDYAQIQISNDAGLSWEPACGQYTEAGTIHQDFGEPVYHDEQDEWVLEEIDLTEFVGSDVLIRFIMKADDFSNADGFNFDDFTISSFDGIMINVENFDSDNFSFSQNHPNPAGDYTVIDLNQLAEGTLFIYNILGQEVYQQDFAVGSDQIVIQTKGWTDGLYNYRFKVDGAFTMARKMIVGR